MLATQRALSLSKCSYRQVCSLAEGRQKIWRITISRPGKSGLCTRKHFIAMSQTHDRRVRTIKSDQAAAECHQRLHDYEYLSG